VHADLKNLELLAETTTVTEAIAAAAPQVVTVQPWLENRDGKRFLTSRRRGYRNLVREIPPTREHKRPLAALG